MAALASVSRPAKARAAHQPFVAGELLAKLDPVIRARTARNLHSAQPGRRSIIVGVDAVDAAHGHVGDFARTNPVHVALEAGVEMIRAAIGRAHRVLVVAVLDAASVADDALPARVPVVGVVQAVVMTELVSRDTDSEVTPEPHTGCSHVTKPRPTPARDRAEADDVVVVVAQHVAGGGCSIAGVRAQLKEGVIATVVGRRLRHAQRRSHGGTAAVQIETAPAIAGFHVVIVQPADERSARAVSKRRAREVREFNADQDQPLGSLRAHAGGNLRTVVAASAVATVSSDLGLHEAFV